MVYISLRKIPSAADDEKVKRWQVLQPDGNEEYIGAILSRKNALSRQNSIEAHTLLDEMLLSLTSIKKSRSVPRRERKALY